jgi:hypothetical protein
MENFIITLAAILGAMITYLLHNNFKISSVKASALPSLLIGLFFHLFPDLLNAHLSQQIPIVFFGATFIGMVSKKMIQYPIYIVIGALLFSVLYLQSTKFFEGYGGALGTTACISTLVAISLHTVLKKFNPLKRSNNSSSSR